VIRIRCSALPRVTQCAPSLVAPAVQIETPSEVGAMGSAVHEWLSHRITGRDVIQDAIVSRWGVDADEFGMLTRVALARWLAVADHFPDPMTEYHFKPINSGGVELTGTADVVSINGDEARILDHKTGWGNGDHEMQMRGYAVLALSLGVERVTACVLRVRLGEIETFTWTKDELAAWWSEMVDRLYCEREIYRPSLDACRYCPRMHECPARTSMVRSVVQSIDPLISEVESYSSISPVTLARVWKQAGLLEDMAAAAKDMVRTQVAAAGGSLPVNDLQELALTESKRREIDVASGSQVLDTLIGDGWRDGLKLSNKSIETAVAAVAPARGKAKLLREVWAELEKADAVRVTTQERLELRRRKLEVIEATNKEVTV